MSKLTPIYLIMPCLLLLVAPAIAKPPCPAQAPCQCTDLRIKCVQQENDQLHYLDKVPYFSPNNRETRWSYSFHELRIRDQAMTNLTLRFAWGVLNVRRVEVTNSLVRLIRGDAFQGLIGVESLNLSHNLLSSLGPDDLRELPSLRELILHNNLIRTVFPGAFRHTSFISKLYLSHNLISEIPPDVRDLTSLTHLYLQYNNISVVRNNAFYGLRKLIILDLGALRSNLIIQRRAFCGLTTHQPAQELQSGGPLTPRDPTGLVALYLRRNILRQLDLCTIGQARSLRGLNLTGSFFPCTCQAVSFASRHDWQRRYGFAPRYVTYEASLLHSCNLDCSSQPEPVCPDACQSSANIDESLSNMPGGLRDFVANDPWLGGTSRLTVRAGGDGGSAPRAGSSSLHQHGGWRGPLVASVASVMLLTVGLW